MPPPRASAAYPALAHDEVVALVTALWESPVHERRMAAVELLDGYAEVLTPADLPGATPAG